MKADKGRPGCPLWAMPAADSLSGVGQHGIDQICNHQYPQVRIGAAHGQTHHLASTAGHHAETQHNRPAGARTSLAATRRPPLVVQKICRIARAADDDGSQERWLSKYPARTRQRSVTGGIKYPDAGSLVGLVIVDYLRPAEYTPPLLRTRETFDTLESHAAGTIALPTKDHFCRTRAYGLESDRSFVTL
jgi:hypothetical protein